MKYTLRMADVGASPLSIGAAETMPAPEIEIFDSATRTGSLYGLTGGVDSLGTLDTNFSSATVEALGVPIISSPGP